MSSLPDWLQPLATAAAAVDPEQMSRFLPPEDGSGRESAVLIALCDTGDGPGVLLIERAADLRDHAGQVAFPGGAVDPEDADVVAAALREAREEVGLDAGTVHVFATLPAVFIPVTGFVVNPVLAWWHDPQPVAAVDPVEVAGCAVVPVRELVDPARRFRVRHPSGFTGPGFDVAGLFVWGFTAGLLDSVLTLAGWNQPWDRTVERDLPDGMLGRTGRS